VKQTKLNLFTHYMTVYLNILCARMIDRVSSNVKCYLAVTEEKSSRRMIDFKISEKTKQPC
jgi:hypothetical protein